MAPAADRQSFEGDDRLFHLAAGPLAAMIGCGVAVFLLVVAAETAAIRAHRQERAL